MDLSKLIEELGVLLKDVPRSEEGRSYREAIADLQELIHSKQLLATEELLKVRKPPVCPRVRLQLRKCTPDRQTLSHFPECQREHRL